MSQDLAKGTIFFFLSKGHIKPLSADIKPSPPFLSRESHSRNDNTPPLPSTAGPALPQPLSAGARRACAEVLGCGTKHAKEFPARKRGNAAFAETLSTSPSSRELARKPGFAISERTGEARDPLPPALARC